MLRRDQSGRCLLTSQTASGIEAARSCLRLLRGSSTPGPAGRSAMRSAARLTSDLRWLRSTPRLNDGSRHPAASIIRTAVRNTPLSRRRPGPSEFHRRGLQRPPSPLRPGLSQPATVRGPQPPACGQISSLNIVRLQGPTPQRGQFCTLKHSGRGGRLRTLREANENRELCIFSGRSGRPRALSRQRCRRPG